MTSPLAGYALRYEINNETATPEDGCITEAGFGSPPSSKGISISYGNNLCQHKDRSLCGPFLDREGTAEEYGEDVPNPRMLGFEKNLTLQFELDRSQGHTFKELNNPDDDHFEIEDVIRGVELAAKFGLGCIAKNPGLLPDCIKYVSHPNIFGIIVKKGAGTADNLHDIRVRSGKPDDPVWFVCFGKKGREQALKRKAEIEAKQYKNMSVTYDAAAQEYGGEIEHILRPITAKPEPQPNPNPSPMPTQVTGKIIDTAQNVAGNLPNLKAAGIGCVIRYLTTNTASEKCIKPDEARAIASAGLSLALVFEVWGGSGNFVHNDINAESGAAHGAFVHGYLPQIGAPKGLIVWFAVDTDVTASQLVSFVVPYFRAAKAALAGDYRIGIYGPGAACAAMLDQGICDAAWLSNAMGWNGSRDFLASNRWRLLQHLPATVAGLDADPDDANGADYGAFIPFGAAPVVPVPQPVQHGTLAANVLAAMASKGYRIETGARPNIIGIIGMDPDGTPNGNLPDKFNDLRVLIWAKADGSVARSKTWICTTDPGKYYVQNRMNAGGAAQIAPGQYTAWQVDLYRGEEALCQWAGPITVQRDDNENFKRDSADPRDTGEFGVHWHGPTGHENILTTVGAASAGCIVARSMPEQREFMAAVKTDERYLADNRFAFTGTILSADEVANTGTSVVPPQPTDRPVLSRGDSGETVSELQSLLVAGGFDVGVHGIDGYFGGDTEDAVRAYQSAHVLSADGVVRQEMWDSLRGTSSPPVQQPGSLSAEVIAKIVALAKASPIARYSWLRDQGVAPIGYTCGMAVGFGKIYQDFKAGKSSALAISKPLGDDEDVLVYYGLPASTPLERLLSTITVQTGLGMLESSGNCYAGLDTNAGFKSADETEAGAFQQSRNSFKYSAELPKLFAEWRSDASDGFLSIWRQGLSGPLSEDLGGGEGAAFQHLCKTKPQFALEACAIGLRVIAGASGHWGPIRNKWPEVRPEAIALFRQVIAIVDAAPVVVIPPIVVPPVVVPPIQPPGPVKTPVNVAIDDLQATVTATQAKLNKLKEQIAMANQSSPDHLPFSIPDIPDGLVRWAWPFIQRLSAEQIIALKRKLLSGQFTLMDLLQIAMGGGQTFLPAPTTINVTPNATPQQPLPSSGPNIGFWPGLIAVVGSVIAGLNGVNLNTAASVGAAGVGVAGGAALGATPPNYAALLQSIAQALSRKAPPSTS